MSLEGFSWRSRAVRWRSVWAAGLLLLAADAGAFCRTRTCQLRNDIPCPLDRVTGCYTNGVPVFWTGTCLSYAIQRDGSATLGISAEQVAPLVADAFRAWSDVTCANGGTPPITALSQGSIACNAVEFNCQVREANSNLIVFRDDFEDTMAFHFGVIALTTVTANKNTGEIFDADIEINSRDEDFVLGPVPPGSTARDLRGVLNHEVGHLLGLSHSRVLGALMDDNYQGTLLPTDDDTAGICAIRAGAAADPECSVNELASDAGCVGSDASCPGQPQQMQQAQSSGCDCTLGAGTASGSGASGSGAASKAGGWLSGLLLSCWLGRRRRQRAAPVTGRR
jgi:hypothetical protein